MKKLILIIIVILGTNNCIKAQTEVPIESWVNHSKNKNVYFKDVNNIYTKFLGTWEYSNGIQYFKITFYKQVKYYDGRYKYFDRIYSHFLYQSNGNTVYDTYPSGVNPTPFTSYVDGHGYIVVNSNKLYLSYQEPSTTGCERDKIGWVTVERQRVGSTWQLVWSRTDENIGQPYYGCTDSNAVPDTSQYQIPASMVLTKVN